MIDVTELPELTKIPEWIVGMEFCHIDDGSGEHCYCGAGGTGPSTCEAFDGEAICPQCGLPTCPRCAQLSALEELLDE